MKLAILLVLLLGYAAAHICVKGRASVYEPKKHQQCGYHNIPSDEQFTALLENTVAIQQMNWKQGAACGMCYEMSGPSSTKPAIFTVSDLCRRNVAWCSGKDKIFHVAMPKQTSWQIVASNINATAVYTKFKMVACPVKGNLKLHIVDGSTKSKFGIRPFNHRYGVKSIQVQENGKLKKMKRSSDNVFWYKSNRKSTGAVNILITSSRNQKIQHSLAQVKPGIVTAIQQFPLSDKKTSRCGVFVDQIIYSDGMSRGVAGKQVAQDYRVLNESNAQVDYDSDAITPRSGFKVIEAKFDQNGTFVIGTEATTSTATIKGIRFFTQSVGNTSFFVVDRNGKVSKSMPIQPSGPGAWAKQFFEFSEYIPNWTEFKGLGFTGSDATLYIDDIWLYLKNNLKVNAKSALSINE